MKVLAIELTVPWIDLVVGALTNLAIFSNGCSILAICSAYILAYNFIKSLRTLNIFFTDSVGNGSFLFSNLSPDRLY